MLRRVRSHLMTESFAPWKHKPHSTLTNTPESVSICCISLVWDEEINMLTLKTRTPDLTPAQTDWRLLQKRRESRRVTCLNSVRGSQRNCQAESEHFSSHNIKTDKDDVSNDKATFAGEPPKYQSDVFAGP